MEDIIKDPYNPVSDYNIWDDQKKKKSKRKLKLEEDVKPLVSFRSKMFFLFIGCLLFIELISIGGINLMFALNDHFAKYEYVRTKVVDFDKLSSAFSWGIERKEREPEISYVKVNDTKVASKIITQKDKDTFISTLNFPKLVRGVHILESNGGTNKNPKAHHNECANLGMTNEFGYRALDNYCFNSFEESAKAVDKWFDEQLKTKTVSESLCYYSMGKVESTCEYAQNFSKLDKDGSLALK